MRLSESPAEAYREAWLEADARLSKLLAQYARHRPPEAFRPMPKRRPWPTWKN
jgi:hypothetical protein